jgi:hypothetical protein
MHRQMLMIVAAVAAISVVACDKKDINGITGSTGFDSITLTSDPTSFSVALGDSAEFTPTAKIEPQDVAIANGIDNMTFTFANPDIAEINGSGYVQGDAVGNTTLTITYTDVDHNYATTSIDVPVSVTGAPPPRIVH